MGTWSTPHLSSNTLFYAYVTFPFGKLQVHFLAIWALEYHFPKLEGGRCMVASSSNTLPGDIDTCTALPSLKDMTVHTISLLVPLFTSVLRFIHCKRFAKEVCIFQSTHEAEKKGTSRADDMWVYLSGTVSWQSAHGSVTYCSAMRVLTDRQTNFIPSTAEVRGNDHSTV